MRYTGIIFYLIALLGVVIVNSVYYPPTYYPFNPQNNYTSYNYSQNNYNISNYGFKSPVRYVDYNYRTKIFPQNLTTGYRSYYYSNPPRFRSKRYSNGFYQYPAAVIHHYVPLTGYQSVPPSVLAHSSPPGASNKSHHLITGIVHFGDRLVYNKNVTDEPFTWFGKVSKYVTYPPRGIQNTRNITVIQVYDLIKDGTGGWARIVNGGVGHRNVTIKLKSQTGKRMSFQVVIYTN
ncbi:uncharacterized protein LOC123299086 isoform X1 [Chrysoperla carnea]|uniref:uncharacterized protein LOC123299086 isoform X1 n=1 Tax=Chrysoperla carnea TaxID=189513 RepID=UPI001D07DAB9|nr:uncharacterized protein LOC123299086 isoform X1 [Chrysoperla carnea]XP_044737240.1 uncharacterized protein LOC123299086 isoform X1 [Chrysoperla carnea]